MIKILRGNQKHQAPLVEAESLVHSHIDSLVKGMVTTSRFLVAFNCLKGCYIISFWWLPYSHILNSAVICFAEVLLKSKAQFEWWLWCYSSRLYAAVYQRRRVRRRWETRTCAFINSQNSLCCDELWEHLHFSTSHKACQEERREGRGTDRGKLKWGKDGEGGKEQGMIERRNKQRKEAGRKYKKEKPVGCFHN